MAVKTISGQKVTEHFYNTIVIGAGAAAMNCVKKLCEFAGQKGVEDAGARIAVVTAGIPLGASRMSGSDKQTYYKMGTSPDIADSAESFSVSLTAAGCCHEDLAMAEAIGSLRGFYNLVEAGVPFPHDKMGVYVGYKTDHDPYERATSAGPKTSKFMSQCLEKIVRSYGVAMHDKQEAVELLTEGEGDAKRIIGVVTIDKSKCKDGSYGLTVFYCKNIVMAAGGPGALYKTSVYPLGQTGMHGLAFKAGLAAENLTESQFGLASTKFRWNVSGTYMQVIPRIFSTDADGNDEQEFLVPFFPSMSKMATDIFLKGYQWPFDPQRIEDYQSSLVDVIVFNENLKGRRVFMDFLKNPIAGEGMDEFKFEDLEPDALDYLKACGAMQELPIDRLAHMNGPAIDIYTENGIDLYKEPLEISVCAQHCNGGFGVNKWWESNVKQAFVIGEMAGTHGVKRPGGSALNAGQVGSQRAAEYIVNVYGCDVADEAVADAATANIEAVIAGLDKFSAGSAQADSNEVIDAIQERMTLFGGHIRRLEDSSKALDEAVGLYKDIADNGLKAADKHGLIAAIQASHLSLMSAATLKAVVEMIKAGSGSRGSHLVLSEDGIEVHADVKDPATGEPLKFKAENEDLRSTILQVSYNAQADGLFDSSFIDVRKAPKDRKAFEPTWTDYRQGKVYE